jgi:pimeloyl-ACP methyl ester carboxylesterase
MATRNSTIVRAYRSTASSVIRGAFGLLDRVAPALGAWWAERIWFTIPRAAAAPRLARPDGGATFEVAVDGRRLRGRRWGDGDPVYLLHGWGGSSSQLDTLVPALVQAGFSVVSFDAPSHGSSDPGPSGRRSSTILEFAEALRAVAARHGRPYGVVAHSAGATAAAVALRDGLPAARAVFLAPMADPRPYADQFAARFGFGERTRTRLVRRIERRVGLPMAYLDVPAMAAQAAMPPLLVVHDQGDRETSWAGGREIARTWLGARMVTTSRLGHRRILRDPAVVAEVVGFLAGAAPPREQEAGEVAS